MKKKLTEKQLARRRKINKIIWISFGILFLLAAIGYLIPAKKPGAPKAPVRIKPTYEQYYQSIKNGLANIGYSQIKESDEYTQFHMKTGNSYYVDYGIPKGVVKEYRDLEGRISKFPQVVSPLSVWETAKEDILGDQVIRRTVELLASTMVENKITIQDIVNEIDNKSSQGDTSRLRIRRGMYSFELQHSPKLKCRFIVDL